MSARLLAAVRPGILASLVAGAIVGPLARLAMLAITLAGGRSDQFAPLSFTLTGVLALVTLPMLYGLPLTYLLALAWPRLPGRGWIRTLTTGTLTLIFPGLLLLTDTSFGLTNANRWLGLPMFVLLYFGYGYLAGGVIHVLRQRAPTRTPAWQYAVLGLAVFSVLVIYSWANAIAQNQ